MTENIVSIRRAGMGSHESGRMKSDSWLTPPGLLEALGEFDLDPCAAPSPRPWPTAAEHIEKPRDGLGEEWHGRVFLNPPYGRETRRWLAKLADHGHGTALIFARTETAMFVEQVWNRAHAVLFLHGRIHFYRPDGERAAMNAGAPSCLVAYGSHDAFRLSEADIDGTFVSLAPN